MKISLIIGCLLLSYVTSSLVVYHPRTLRDKIDPVAGEISASLANFGNIPYGHSVIGRVWYDPDNNDGCNDFNIPITGVGDPDATPSPIVLVTRGECPFVKKVRNIEHAGGALAVIVDNKPGEKVDNVIMIDDGSGNGINIPSMLISKEHGEAIIETIENCDAEHSIVCVQLLASFDLPHPDNRVEYEFWYTSSSDESLDFLQDFGDYHKQFQKDVFFTPKFVSWPCEYCNDDLKTKHCFSDGKYCAFHFGNSNHTGQEILYENLREKCLHDQLQKKGDDDLWWDYIKIAHTLCRDDINEDCSKRAIERIGYKFKDIKKCVEESFVGDDHTKEENLILQKEHDAWTNQGPHYFPAITINNQTYRGALIVEHVFESLCRGFKEVPDECKQFSSKNRQGNDHGITVFTLVLIVVGVLICNFVLLCCYHKRDMQNEIRTSANTAVSQYFAVQNFDKDEARRPNI